ncbi:MAG: PucR family transcriptional regulator ligand-binding domain-containing protein [Ornithinimicrobium sp.]
MPNLTEMCAVLGDDLQPEPGAGLPAEPLTAVHVSELSDPTPFLEGGELLLTTGMPWALTGLDTTAYVSRLVQRGVLGLALGLGPVYAEVPPVLRTACLDRGLALLTVPPPTPFLTISRAYWGLLARSGREQLNAALGAQQSLVQASAGPRPGETTVHRLAGAIDGWAALLSPSGEVRTVRPRGREPAAQAASTEIARLRMAGPHSSATFPLEHDDVVVYPLSVGSRLTGFIAAGCPRPMRPADRHLIVTAAALLAPRAPGASQTMAERRGIRAVIASVLLDGEIDLAHRLMQEFDVTGFASPVRLLVVHPGPSEQEVVDEAVRRLLVPAGQPWLIVQRGRSAVVVLPAGIGAADVQRFHAWLTHEDPSIRVRVSAPVDGRDIKQAYRGLAAEVAAMRPGVVSMPTATPPWEGSAPIDLGPLRDYTRSDLVSAVVAYLRVRGHWEQASRDLGVHRNTLRHRIATAAQVLDVDVDDPDVAARLWLSLREAHLT